MMSQELEQRRDALKRAMEHNRSQFVSAVDELENVVRSRANIRKRIASNPYHWLGAGLMLGMLLGSRGR